MKTCKVDGCNCEVTRYPKQQLCNKHYTQIHKYGKILDRTSKDKNEIVLYEDYAEIILYNKKQEEVARTLIDLDDVEKVKKYKWVFSHRYVVNGNTGLRLHRFIMNAPEDKVVDHINHNKLDNRKCNLRVCTQSQNTMNSSLRSDNTSGYTGVYWYKSRSKWLVRITVNGKCINLGYYDDLEEAVKVRKEAEIKYFGEYRRLE